MQRIDLETVVAAIIVMLLSTMFLPLAWIMLIVFNLDLVDLHVDLPKGKVGEVGDVVEVVETKKCRNVWDSVPHPEFCQPTDRLGKECMIATRVIVGKECK